MARSKKPAKKKGVEPAQSPSRSSITPRRQEPQPQFPVKLTEAQRKAIAEIAPELTDRLRLDQRNQRTVGFTTKELRAIHQKVSKTVRQTKGPRHNALKHLLDSISQAIEGSRGSVAIPPRDRVYQFKITLLDSRPPIWRRIQVKDCTFDKLHEHIQTAMGWTNSHLHHFKINGRPFGDPMLMEENFEEFGYQDSTTTKLSEILPRSGRRFPFEYEYDFGDSWEHEVLFEGYLRAEPGRRYPVCLEGERACPPEDCGGVWGYADFVEAIRDPNHPDHGELLEWVGRPFDPEEFDSVLATKEMKRGLPDWRHWD
jgi:hypothetical protein